MTQEEIYRFEESNVVKTNVKLCKTTLLMKLLGPLRDLNNAT